MLPPPWPLRARAALPADVCGIILSVAGLCFLASGLPPPNVDAPKEGAKTGTSEQGEYPSAVGKAPAADGLDEVEALSIVPTPIPSVAQATPVPTAAQVAQAAVMTVEEFEDVLSPRNEL